MNIVSSRNLIKYMHTFGPYLLAKECTLLVLSTIFHVSLNSQYTLHRPEKINYLIRYLLKKCVALMCLLLKKMQ